MHITLLKRWIINMYASEKLKSIISHALLKNSEMKISVTLVLNIQIQIFKLNNDLHYISLFQILAQAHIRRKSSKTMSSQP